VSRDNRLATGGRIDRSRVLSFTFNGRRYRGHPGDTLASALLANDVAVVGRSFKYHRPRGILSAGVEEPNALVQLETGAHTQPNLPATTIELYDGLNAASVNCWPSVDFDVRALTQWFSPILPAGFYYKTFMGPAGLWMTYERMIRRAAGLGTAPDRPDPDTYDKMHAHCDVLVVGGGPAGLAAALAAGRTGARVILADQDSDFGGRLLGERMAIDDAPAMNWVDAAVKELAALDEVRLLPRTTAFGYYDHNYLGLLERRHAGSPGTEAGARERLWKVRARRVVLATGAIERPLVFADNDRPGVMLAGAVRAYVNRFGVDPGRKVLVFANNDDGYRTALDLADAGVRVVAVVDLRSDAAGMLREKTLAQGIEVLSNFAVVRAHGRKRVRAVDVMALDAGGKAVTGSARRIDCDVVAVSGGWNPAIHLFSQSGGKARFDETYACFVPGVSVQAERSAGAANGAFGLDACLAEGFAVGTAAAAGAGFTKASRRKLPSAEAVEETPLRPLWVVPSRKGQGKGHGRGLGKHFVDLHNDVAAADIALAAREGYQSVEHAKRYTTLGMGTDQGKTGNIHGLAVLADARGAEIPAVGTTTFRPPYTPVTFGAFAGRDIGALADPVRMTAMHQWHVRAGARFEDVGQWKRPWYYPRPGEGMREAVDRECLAARNAVGILDASTLGKIDIQGPDAATLLNRIYTNAWSKLAIGRCRYGMMCGEDGMVFDDGVTARLGEHHYLMSTTSGGAARVMGWLEEWLQTEWPDLRVYLNSVTETWATASVSGPFARRLLAELTDTDLSNEAFPHMSVQGGRVAGLPARIFRVSFTGEQSYEINVPARYGLALWTALIDAGEDYGITPFGTEAMHVLRAEKGYVITGQDTDGSVTPIDLGMDWIVSKTKDFIGKRSLARPDTLRADRKQFVGLLTDDPAIVLPEGAQVVDEPKAAPPMAMIGHVTSSYHSANLGRSIALALIKGGRERIGATVHVALADRTVTASIADPVFFDPEGKRLDG
jgi:sarcosine oxidase subunit alpha